jgi:hypothetical protein
LVGVEGEAGDFAVADGDKIRRKEVKEDAVWKSLVWLGWWLGQRLRQRLGKRFWQRLG